MERLSSSELIILGKSSFKNQKYKVARDYFLAVRKREKDREAEQNLEICDYLAAVYEHLEEFDKALLYGKEMIKCFPTNARGYLRLGRTLEKTGTAVNMSKILPIYQKGMTRVNGTDPKIGLLNRLCEKYQPVHCIDPLTVLPIELVYQIISHLSFFQRVSCLRVSKGWNQFFSSQTHLWTALDLTESRHKRPPPPKFVKSCIKLSAYKLQTLNLGSFSHRDTILAILKCCKQLDSLDLSLKGFCANTGLFLENVRQLRALRIRDCFIKAEFVGKLLSQCALEELHLDYKHQPVSPDIFKDDCWANSRNLTTFKSLKIDGNADDISQSQPDYDFRAWLTKVTNLENLELSRNSITLPGSITWSVCANLKRLKLNRITADGYFSTAFPATLQVLHLCNVRGSAESPPEPCAPLPQLRELVYENCVWGPALIEILLSGYGELASSGRTVGSMSYLQIVRIAEFDWKAPSNLINIPTINSYANVFSHPRMTRVESLALNSSLLEDDDVEELLGKSQNLTRVAFTTAAITGIGVKNLISKYSSIKILVVRDCRKVSGDAVEWARNQGVTVWNFRGTDTGNVVNWYGD